MAVECSNTAVAMSMRIGWRTGGRILERPAKRLNAAAAATGEPAPDRDRRDLLRKGQRYLTVTVGYHGGRLVWAGGAA